MTWVEQSRQLSFEQQPISGLAFLHGDVVARRYQQEWAAGKKYPLIHFPSGTSHELSEQSLRPFLHLFGDLHIPHSATSQETIRLLTQQVISDGIQATWESRSRLLIVRPSTQRAYRLSYTFDGDQLTDVSLLPTDEMELLPGHMRAILPPLYANERRELDETYAPLKFFTPDANWTWYATEFDGHDIFFGLVDGFERELGYFTLSELEAIRGPFGLSIERDQHYQPQSLHYLMNPPRP
jgi:hypothetical protein